MGRKINVYNSEVSFVNEVLQNIFDDYGFLNMWSSENLLIDGTTTTLLDYSGEHDLVNPDSISQPSFNTSDSGFNNRPSITFDGVNDNVEKLTPNWRSSDASGVFIGVFKVISGTDPVFLSTSDVATEDNFLYNFIDVNITKFIIAAGGNNTLKGSIVINDSNPHIVTFASDDVSYRIVIDGVNDTVNATSGSDNGAWFAALPDVRDNIMVGGLGKLSPLYSNIDWVMSGYLPYTTTQDIIDVQNELKTYYGI